MKQNVTVLLILALLNLALADYPNPDPITGDINVRDPVMIKIDGTYYVYSTGPNIKILKSTDRVNFQQIGVVWPDGAPWTFPFTNNGENLWAPDISFHNGKFYLYYAASTLGSQNSAIFLATSPTGLPGSWDNLGVVLQSDSSADFNAIDPNLIVDEDGSWWLSYGSYWSGVKILPLDPNTGKPKDDSHIDLAAVPEGVRAIEAPYIIYRDGFYYLFVSHDRAENYKVMVGRSRSVTGRYFDRDGKNMMAGGGTEVVARHGSILGTGHEGLMLDDDGWVLLYHYSDGADPDGPNLLGINRLEWDEEGWPYII